MTVRLKDNASVSKAYVNDDGYLVATVKIARTGIQQYTKRELGLMGDGIVNVYRPDTEVFHKDSLKSLAHAAVTVGHPDEPVTADNWSDLAVGEVSADVLRDGEWLTTAIIVKDAKAQRQEARELSAGYNCDLEFVDGVTPSGEPYGAIQKNIVFNHLAIVPSARAGSLARIGDGALNWGAAPKPKEVPHVELKIVTLGDNEAVNIAVADAAKIEKYKSDFAKKLTDADTVIGELTAQLADAKSKILSDADIELRVADRLTLLDAARKVHAELVADGKSSTDIKREVVAHKFGDAIVADMSDAAIDGMFKVATTVTLTANDTARNVLKDTKATMNDFDKRQEDAVNAFLHPKGVK